MSSNLSIKEQRAKALAILEDKHPHDSYQPLDYAIDDECRSVLNLPVRPANSQPYIGWMIGSPKVVAPVGKLSKAGLEHIASYEGCKLEAYQCPAKKWTIGYGHTNRVFPGMTITKDEARRLFQQDLAEFEAVVRAYVRVPLNQGQFDALVSFTFNVGAEAFRTSTLLKTLNQGRYKAASMEFHRWVRVGEKTLSGLVRRRNDEYGMFAGEG
jgi:lysozyme